MKKKIVELNKKLFLYLSLAGLLVSSSFAIAQNRLAIEEVKEQCKLAGMDGYVGKPFTSDELVEQLNQVIN